MRNKFIYIFFLVIFLSNVPVSADEMTGQGDFYNIDFNAIDNPFSGQKMVTEQEYQKALEQYKQASDKKKNKGFWNWVFKHTIPEDKQYTPPNPSSSTYSDEIKYQKEAMSQKPTIALSDSVTDSRGKLVEKGFYQVVVEDAQLKLVQGYDVVGIFNARRTTDKYDENEIIYARIVYQGENVVRIIYSNLDDCYEAFAVVKKED